MLSVHLSFESLLWAQIDSLSCIKKLALYQRVRTRLFVLKSVSSLSPACARLAPSPSLPAVLFKYFTTTHGVLEGAEQRGSWAGSGWERQRRGEERGRGRNRRHRRRGRLIEGSDWEDREGDRENARDVGKGRTGSRGEGEEGK